MNILETLHLKTVSSEYDITVGSGVLSSACDFMNLNRRVLIVTDSGVPREYAEAVAAVSEEAKIFTFPEGEESKNIRTLEQILSEMLTFGMQRGDCAVAVGGGVVGDITGFAAACYMRGIDFYNIPTTLLAQVDSSIGGKTAIDFMGTKNIVGAFHQPRAVLIDTEVLKTLPERQISAGLAEAIKMALTSDAPLFEKIERLSVRENLAEIIIGALKIKKRIVELDEKEGSIRKLLNFGHTFGHGIEAVSELYHGECVALGMIPMCSDRVRERLIPVLKKCRLPISYDFDREAALEFMRHDKKGLGSHVDAVFVDDAGCGYIKRTELTELWEIIRKSGI